MRIKKEIKKTNDKDINIKGKNKNFGCIYHTKIVGYNQLKFKFIEK
jgi:hypothetical protein